jgi:hypothetical protein
MIFLRVTAFIFFVIAPGLGSAFAAQKVSDRRLHLREIEQLECNIVDQGNIVTRRVIGEDKNFDDAFWREKRGQLNDNDKAKLFMAKTGTFRMDLQYQTLSYGPPSKSHIDEGVAASITFLPNNLNHLSDYSTTARGFLRNLDDYIQMDGPQVRVNCRIYRENRDGIKDARGWR